MLLNLPVEIRLHIYEIFLDDHQRLRRNGRQPSNAHLRVLGLCRAIRYEAALILRQYISLSHELQINVFIRFADNHDCSHIQWADVANDGRFFRSDGADQGTPVSNLHIALRCLPNLKHLRVFECRRGIPMGVHRKLSFMYL